MAACTCLVIARQLELELDGLFQPFEAPLSPSARIHDARCECRVPFRLFLLQCRHAQEFIYGRLGVVGLELFCIVVLVFDVDVATLLVVVILVFEVIPQGLVRYGDSVEASATYSSSPESCMKSSSSDMFVG